MAYEKTDWINGTTAINQTRLNKIENGIYDIDQRLIMTEQKEIITSATEPTEEDRKKYWYKFGVGVTIPEIYILNDSDVYEKFMDNGAKYIVDSTETATNDFVNGKRIYFKKINVASFPNTTAVDYDHGLVNTAVQLYKTEFAGRDAGGTYQVGTGDNNIRFTLAPTNKLKITTNSNYSPFSGYVIIYYYYI